IFRLQRPLLALFLNRLFATDGWATVLSEGQTQLGYATVSERLARQIQHLLLRFGVIASLRKRLVQYRDQRREAWQLDITDQRAIGTFIEEIGIFGKEMALARVSRAMEGRNYQTNRDLIPRTIWERLNEARGNESWASVARRMGLGDYANMHVGRRDLSRRRLMQMATTLGDHALQQLAASVVYWDAIVSVEYVGL